MNMPRKPAAFILVALLGAAMPGGLSAQQNIPPGAQEQISVYGALPADLAGMARGPQVEGFISARQGRELQVTSPDGAITAITVADATDIKGSGGFLGLGRTALGADSLLNGLPVSVETVTWENGLVASRIRFRNADLETAAMIRGATAQRFAQHDEAIEENAAATEALRGRVANIDQYNIRGTANVYFDTGKWNLSAAGERDLCATAQDADAMGNSLLLVVGYTDSVGDPDYNQLLSERRAGRVVNFLQQKCRWAPWRMLTPTGMAESDPLADNNSAAGRAQNRRVSVNILVSKALD